MELAVPDLHQSVDQAVDRQVGGELWTYGSDNSQQGQPLTNKPIETHVCLLIDLVLDHLPVLGEDLLELVLLQVELGPSLNGEHQLTRGLGVGSDIITETFRLETGKKLRDKQSLTTT